MSYFLLNIADTIFVDLMFNENKKIDIWDVFQGLLGYYIKTPEGEITYLQLKDNTLVTTPLALQLLGIFYAISFMWVPLSFHTMVKPRLIKNKTYIWFFFRESTLKAFSYGGMLCLTLIAVS